MTWFRSKFPTILIFSIPNGGKRAVSTAKRLKAEGMVRGIPDLYIPQWRLWVEMKRQRGGSLSKEQREIHDYLRSIGDTVIVGRGARDASRQVMDFLE